MPRVVVVRFMAVTDTTLNDANGLTPTPTHLQLEGPLMPLPALGFRAPAHPELHTAAV